MLDALGPPCLSTIVRRQHTPCMRLTKPNRWVAIAMGLPLLYVISYYANVTPNRGYHATSVNVGPDAVPLILAADYRLGGEVARWLYKPMERLDRRILPRRWI